MSSSAKRSADASCDRQYRSFLEAVREIATVLPQQEAATVRSISFDQRHIVLSGDADDFSHFDRLVSALRNLKGYKVNEKFQKRGRRRGPTRLFFDIELVPTGARK